jgi:hypothetical protein
VDTKRYVVLDLDGTLHPRTAGMDLLNELTQRGLCSPSGAAKLRAFVGSLRPEKLHTRTSVSIAYQLWADAIRGASAPAAERRHTRCGSANAWRCFRTSGPLSGFCGNTATGLRCCPAAHTRSCPRQRPTSTWIMRRERSFTSVLVSTQDGFWVTSGVSGTKLGLLGSMLPAPLNLGSAIAIGNSITDIDLFGAVGHPITFEPDQLLRRVATRFGWPVADRGSIQTVMTAVVQAHPAVS